VAVLSDAIVNNYQRVKAQQSVTILTLSYMAEGRLQCHKQIRESYMADPMFVIVLCDVNFFMTLSGNK
jgi:hypothetical protein